MADEFDEWDVATPVRSPSPSWLWGCFQGALVVAGFFLSILVVLTMISPRRPDHGKLGCLSNLRQIGLGFEAYASARGCYPPGTYPNPDLPLERRAGWGLAILPYVDHADYLPERGQTQEAAAQLAWDDPVFSEINENPPGVAKCRRKSEMSYVAIAGLGLDSPALPTNHKRAGMFGDDRIVRLADIKDGRSNTMMATESDSKVGPWAAGGRATVRGLDSTNQPYIGQGRQFGGLHDGGTAVLMADGSVRFVSESIDPKVFEAMSTIAGGEKVSVSRED